MLIDNRERIIIRHSGPDPESRKRKSFIKALDPPVKPEDDGGGSGSPGPFDMPFDKLRVLSNIEGLTAMGKVERLRGG